MEALGYVVGCDIRKGNSNATIGFRIIVESHYPLPVVHSRMEEGLLSLDDFLFDMSSLVIKFNRFNASLNSIYASIEIDNLFCDKMYISMEKRCLANKNNVSSYYVIYLSSSLFY